MSVIFAVSPHYLEALYLESKDFDFSLQGYGNFKDAYHGLSLTNQSDILGFLFVSESLPKKMQNLMKFIKMCNEICRYRKRLFLFYCNNKQIRQLVGISKEFTNLQFEYVVNSDVLTNVTIRRDLFGRILIDNYSPYHFKSEERAQIGSLPVLEYTPLFTKQALMVLDPVIKYDSVDSTIELDSVYCQLARNFPYLAMVRKKKIKMLFGEDCAKEDKAMNELLLSVSDNKIYCTYKSLDQIVTRSEES